jgi:hypothetical protein
MKILVMFISGGKVNKRTLQLQIPQTTEALIN